MYHEERIKKEDVDNSSVGDTIYSVDGTAFTAVSFEDVNKDIQYGSDEEFQTDVVGTTRFDGFLVDSSDDGFYYALENGEDAEEYKVAFMMSEEKIKKLISENVTFKIKEDCKIVLLKCVETGDGTKIDNLDYVLPSEGSKGTLSYVQYKGVLSDDQDLGIYTPAGYDANREQPYKTVYMSHGGGGNETDWFAMGHVDNIIDNLGEDIVIVTMDNSSFGWDFEKIEENVMDYIIPYVEENYNVSKEASDRAFCGLSMGCMTTYHMYYDHPTDFAYFGGFSGPDMTAIKDSEGLENATLFFTVGTCDIASEKVMANEEGKQIKYENYVEYLKTSTKEKTIDGGYIYGAHDWFTWSQSFYRFITEVAFK